jgi:hypothetical protein
MMVLMLAPFLEVPARAHTLTLLRELIIATAGRIICTLSNIAV